MIYLSGDLSNQFLPALKTGKPTNVQCLSHCTVEDLLFPSLLLGVLGNFTLQMIDLLKPGSSQLSLPPLFLCFCGSIALTKIMFLVRP